MTTSLTIYDEIADFLASLSPDKVLAFHLSDNVKKRLNSLLDKQQLGTLTEVERREVEHHLIINNIISLAKARARKLLKLLTQ
jgi:hypothetical protein